MLEPKRCGGSKFLPMGDTETIAALVPDVVSQADRERAVEIVSSFDRDDPSWLAEAYMLLNTGTLHQEDLRYMGSTIFRDGGWTKEIRLATYVAARLGTIGFSFPKWRFPAQSFGDGASLLERFGMARLERPTDVRDPAAAGPARDLFGTGFVLVEGSSYVELRRAYVAISDRLGRTPATIVVRNSSFFFGRDRLAHPAYVCWEPLFACEIEALAPEDFEESGRFVPWHLAFPRHNVADPCEGLFAVADLLASFARLERDMERWLRRDGPPLRRDYRTNPDGRAHLLDFLESHVDSGNPPFLAEIRTDLPPWFPLQTADSRVDDVVPFLRPAKDSNTRLALLSGRSGDMPLATAAAGGQIPAK
jgi:hypothetical protein